MFFPTTIESAIKYVRQTQRKQFSIKMRQTWFGPQKQDTDFHVHAYAFITADVIHATFRTRSTILASLGNLVQI